MRVCVGMQSSSFEKNVFKRKRQSSGELEECQESYCGMPISYKVCRWQYHWELLLLEVMNTTSWLQ